MKRKTEWIYGLKLLASILVIVHHFALYFFPAFINNSPASVKTSGAIELMIVKTPFNILSYGGNVCVCIFFVISGFLIAYKYYVKKDRDFSRQAFSRYFKLTLPVFFVAMIYFLAFWLISLFLPNYLCSTEIPIGSYCDVKYDILQLLYDSFIGLYNNGNVYLAPILWTMRCELFGSFVVIACLALFGDNKKRKYIWIIILLITRNFGTFSLLVGMILCDLYFNGKVFNKVCSKWYVRVILIVPTIIFCGYTYELISVSDFYKLLPGNWISNDLLLFYHTIGVFCLLIIILYSNVLKKLLSLKVFTKFKNISFEVYLFHWMIINIISIPLFKELNIYYSYKVAFVITFMFSMILIFTMSYLLGELILDVSNKITKKICKKFYPSK